MIRILSRRPDGRKAILNSPLVVRAINSGKIQSKKSQSLRRGEKLVESVRKAERKVSQAKGCTTKALQKLSRAEARNKGLRTMLMKVMHTQ